MPALAGLISMVKRSINPFSSRIRTAAVQKFEKDLPVYAVKFHFAPGIAPHAAQTCGVGTIVSACRSTLHIHTFPPWVSTAGLADADAVANGDRNPGKHCCK